MHLGVCLWLSNEESLGANRRVLSFQRKAVKLHSAKEAVRRKIDGARGKVFIENDGWFLRPIEVSASKPEDEEAPRDTTQACSTTDAAIGEPSRALSSGMASPAGISSTAGMPVLADPASTPGSEPRTGSDESAALRQLPNKLMSQQRLVAQTSKCELGAGGYGEVKFDSMQNGALATSAESVLHTF